MRYFGVRELLMPSYLLLILAVSCGGRMQDHSATSAASAGVNGLAGGSEAVGPSTDPAGAGAPSADEPNATPMNGSGADAIVGAGSQGKPCPPVAPTPGDACGNVAIWCVYGDSVRYDCRQTLYCSAKGWQQLATSTCQIPPQDYCPGTAPTNGDTCTPWHGDAQQGVAWAAGICTYEDGSICGCRALEKEAEWRCSAPPSTKGCPPLAPNYGTPCADQGVDCTYNDPCTTGVRVICRNNTWARLDPGVICSG